MDGDVRNPISADRYERLELIGTGSFGDVYRGWDREDGLEVAIKVIDLEEVEDDIVDIHREVAILAQCRSSNITEYYASVLQSGTTELLIVMELMACSVCDLLSGESSTLDERSIAFVLRETLKALVYLHSTQRIHRDVKSANILLSAHGEVKISDFGVSGQLSKTVAFKRRTFVGSPFWMAPEVIKANTGGDGYGHTADIWSLGITAYEMAHGKPPHADLHPMRALFLIPAEDAPRLDGPFSQEFKSFVAQCLQKDPALRPSAAALLRHPFLAGPHDSGRLAELVQIHAEVKREAKASSGQAVRSPGRALGTARWDFDTLKQRDAPSAPEAPARGSIRSHQINSFTVRDSTWGSTFASRQLQQHAAHGKNSELVAEEAGPLPPASQNGTGSPQGRRSFEHLPAALSAAEPARPSESSGTVLARDNPHAQIAEERDGQADDLPLESRHTRLARKSLASRPHAFQNAADNELLSAMLESVLNPQSQSPSKAGTMSRSAAGGLEPSSQPKSCPPLTEALRFMGLGAQGGSGLSPIGFGGEGPPWKTPADTCTDASEGSGALGSYLLARWQQSTARRSLPG